LWVIVRRCERRDEEDRPEVQKQFKALKAELPR
jgi:hypothetical protein